MGRIIQGVADKDKISLLFSAKVADYDLDTGPSQQAENSHCWPVPKPAITRGDFGVARWARRSIAMAATR